MSRMLHCVKNNINFLVWLIVIGCIVTVLLHLKDCHSKTPPGPDRPPERSGRLDLAPTSRDPAHNDAGPGGYSLENLLDAIEWVESKGVATAIGDDGEIGAYQLKEIYVDDVNRIVRFKRPTAVAITGDIFTYNDRLDKQKSRVMVGIYTTFYALKVWDEVVKNSHFLETKEGLTEFYKLQSRIHKGGPRGYENPATKPYWLKVKARMDIRL